MIYNKLIMEKGLHERDIVGLQDFVLLEDCNSETAFIENLKKRFHADLIYVSTIRFGREIKNWKFAHAHSALLWVWMMSCRSFPLAYQSSLCGGCLFVSCTQRLNFCFLLHFEYAFPQTYIGQVLISVNPYRELPIYSEQDIKSYRRKHFFEAPPHM